jgi:uracil-DNA glycosylase
VYFSTNLCLMSVNLDPKIENSWKQVLYEEFQSDYFLKLKSFLQEERKNQQVFPPGGKIFEAFNLTPFPDVKVVIIGQDPYHNVGQAHGLCFSVQRGVAIPPSLLNIFKELQQDLGISRPVDGDLSSWARQGVFLLNATLTVRAHQAGSHQRKGWERFTDAAIRAVSQQREHVVFLLWGNYAQKKEELIDASRHLILKSVHPSPLSASRGFFGNHHFSQTNDYLRKHGIQSIDWQL